MRKIISALTILALAGGFGALATGTAFASAAPRQVPSHRQPAGRDAYQQPRGQVNLPGGRTSRPQRTVARPDDGNQNPPQRVVRSDGEGDRPPQVAAA